MRHDLYQISIPEQDYSHRLLMKFSIAWLIEADILFFQLYIISMKQSGENRAAIIFKEIIVYEQC